MKLILSLKDLPARSNCQGDRFAGIRCFAILWVLFHFMGSNSQINAETSVAGIVWEAAVLSEGDYSGAVEALFQTYEGEPNKKDALEPQANRKVGIKVNCRNGVGLSTPHGLIRSVINALVKRGFERSSILIVDRDSYALRLAGILPSLTVKDLLFEGCPVLALDTNEYFAPDWFYDSPLPSQFMAKESASFSKESSEVSDADRKSFLPIPLMFEVDFWINLPVGCDDPALGVDGALANMTLWNVSNSRRFLVNQATASAAVAEIAAIPELVAGAELHLMPMDYYQFIGGPSYNSLYTDSKPVLRLSADPVALDRLLIEDLNEQRRVSGFPEIIPLPQQLSFAASLGLGVFKMDAIEIRKVSIENLY